jgi:RNA polymerase sigma-70 factor (ECF subfamily)
MDSVRDDSTGRREGQPGSAPDAAAEFVRAALRAHERPLVAYARHLLGGDGERARDVVQEAYFRLCAEPRERVDGRVREWLYAVCRNLAVDIRRKERRLRAMDPSTSEALSSQEATPEEALEREDAYTGVLGALQTLSANQQEVVRLKFQHGMSYKQISEVTDLSVTNIGFLLHTAIKTLRQQLGAEIADQQERHG